MSKIRLPAKIDRLARLIKFISTFAEEQGYTQKQLREIELASEEAMINIINYAYQDETMGDIEVRCRMKDGVMLEIEISDTGILFDSNSFDDPDLNASVAERKIGGLGIYIIRQLMDEVNYRREDNKNILNLVLNKSAE